MQAEDWTPGILGESDFELRRLAANGFSPVPQNIERSTDADRDGAQSLRYENSFEIRFVYYSRYACRRYAGNCFGTAWAK